MYLKVIQKWSTRHIGRSFWSQDGVKWKFGDRRGDVHPGATMLTTIFIRNHNKLAESLAKMHPNWDDEKLYQVE